jgi:hypothetical protein
MVFFVLPTFLKLLLLIERVEELLDELEIEYIAIKRSTKK